MTVKEFKKLKEAEAAPKLMEITSEMLDCLEEHGMDYLYNVGANKYISINTPLRVETYIENFGLRGVRAPSLRDLVDLENKKLHMDHNYKKHNALKGKEEGATQTIRPYFDYSGVEINPYMMRVASFTNSKNYSTPCLKVGLVLKSAEDEQLEWISNILGGDYPSYVFNPSQLEVLKENGFEVPKCKIF